MQLDIDIETTFRFTHVRYYIDKQKDTIILRVISYKLLAQTDRQKVTHESPPCNMHRWA